jgi:Uma2 family endonuclease
MTIDIRRVSLEEFEAFIYDPQNVDREFELIGGEIYEVVANSYSSRVAMLIGAMITVFVNQHKLGRVTGADGGYMVEDERYIPDVGFISYARQPEEPHTAYNPLPPDLAVEVISPTDDTAKIRIKIANYTHAGTTVWLIDPEKQTVEIYAPDAPAVILDHTGTLSGGTILPGFSLPIKDIFPAQE